MDGEAVIGIIMMIVIGWLILEYKQIEKKYIDR